MLGGPVTSPGGSPRQRSAADAQFGDAFPWLRCEQPVVKVPKCSRGAVVDPVGVDKAPLYRGRTASLGGAGQRGLESTGDPCHLAGHQYSYLR